MEKNLIVLVEDETALHELLRLHLEKAGFRFKAFAEAKPFLDYLEKNRPELIILDWMLPDADGLELCRFLKNKEETRSIPIIMLTAKSDEVDRILGLEMGADDYISKPFSVRELVARVKAILRRFKPSPPPILRGGPITLDPERHEVMVNDEKIELTPVEFNLLKILLSRKGWVFTRDRLLDLLWSGEKFVTDRTIDVHISNLRAKLGKAGELIKNIRGIGYKFEEE
ncbi:MAG: response regulator transcription factor [Candidatus Aminicenantes bacterium]|nr:response regulator transcription factor [Candidatus Aminicenantes bacterium]